MNLYGKVDGLHYFSDNKGSRRRLDLCASWFEGKHRLLTSLPVTASGEYEIQGNTSEQQEKTWTRVAFAGLKFQGMSVLRLRS
ncbi:porin [Escherichia coli]